MLLHRNVCRGDKSCISNTPVRIEWNIYSFCQDALRYCAFQWSCLLVFEHLHKIEETHVFNIMEKMIVLDPAVDGFWNTVITDDGLKFCFNLIDYEMSSFLNFCIWVWRLMHSLLTTFRIYRKMHVVAHIFHESWLHFCPILENFVIISTVTNNPENSWHLFHWLFTFGL